MALAKTVEHLKSLLMEILHDLEKASTGNKAAAQRARKHTIMFAKAAKVYRKESVAEGRKGKKTKTKKPTTHKKATAKRKPARKKTTARRKAKHSRKR